MKEYGGYLPFELRKGNEYYSGENVVALNCARNGIVYAVLEGGFTRIHVPFYMCSTVPNVLKKYQIPYDFYHIDKSLMPLGLEIKENECVLYPNYFGLISEEQINKIIDRYHAVILDNTQAFFAKPHMQVYNIYSCRKFIGVSDGAYVIKEGIRQPKYPVDKSYHRMEYLFQSIEQGTDLAYQKSLQLEEELNVLPICEMSKLTHCLLQAVDYEQIIRLRKENFDYLDDCFCRAGIMSVHREKESVPMVYPFYCDKAGIREKLIEKHIYVPQWWAYLLASSEINNFERNLAKLLMPLPVDQRYSKEDMKKMFRMIAEII